MPDNEQNQSIPSRVENLSTDRLTPPERHLNEVRHTNFSPKKPIPDEGKHGLLPSLPPKRPDTPKGNKAKRNKK